MATDGVPTKVKIYEARRCRQHHENHSIASHLEHVCLGPGQPCACEQNRGAKSVGSALTSNAHRLAQNADRSIRHFGRPRHPKLMPSNSRLRSHPVFKPHSRSFVICRLNGVSLDGGLGCRTILSLHLTQDSSVLRVRVWVLIDAFVPPSAWRGTHRKR